MGFSWLFEENFEDGTKGLFNTETDTASILDFPHYTELARQGMAPYQGAYACRVRPNGGTTSGYLIESDGFDTSAAGTIFVRFNVYLGKDLVMTDTDKFTIFDLESTLNTTSEVACGLIRSGTAINFWMSETAATTTSVLTLGTTTTALGKWYQVELKALIDSGGPNDGTLDGWVNGTPLTQITALDQAAIVNARIGAIGVDAGTSGTLLFHRVMADDARIFPEIVRFGALNYRSTALNNHVLVGPGKFAMGFTSGGTDGVASVYDTDGVPSELTPAVKLRNVTALESVPGHDIFEVQHGAYVVISGTTAPDVYFSIESGGMLSEAGYVNRGLKTKSVQPQLRSN